MPTLDHVSLDISVVLGTTVMPIHQVLRLGRGAIIELAQGEEDEVIFCQADLALGDTFKQHIFNFAAHRRPEHYGLILERVGTGPALGKTPLP